MKIRLINIRDRITLLFKKQYRFSKGKLTIICICLSALLFLASAATIKINSNNEVPHAEIGQLSLDSSTAWLQSEFDSIIGDNFPVIGLGEVSHGGYQPLALKAKMIQYLVEKKGYRKILFEFVDINISPIREYLMNNQIKDTTVINSIIKNGNYTPATEKALTNLFRWLKYYNLEHPKDKVWIAGFDFFNFNSEYFYTYFVYYYLIPFDYKYGQDIIFQWGSKPLSDSLKFNDISSWFEKNKSKLKNEMSKQEYDFLRYNIKNEAERIRYISIGRDYDDSKKGAVQQILYRDSIMADNIEHLTGSDRAVVWAHNTHIYRGGLNMGGHLSKKYNDKYFVLLTDFSEEASVSVLNSNDMSYKTVTIASEPISIGYKLLHDYGIKRGIFFHKDLVAHKIFDYINTIDVFGNHFILVDPLNNSYDAIAVFNEITPGSEPSTK